MLDKSKTLQAGNTAHKRNKRQKLITFNPKIG